MRTETIEIYQFDELSEEAKKKAIEQVRQSYYEYNNFAEWAIDQCYLFQPEEMMDKEEIIKNTRENLYFSTGRNWYIKCDEAMEVANEKAFLNWLGIPEGIHDEIEYQIYTTYGRSTYTTIEIIPDDGDADTQEKLESKYGISFQEMEEKFQNEIVLKALERIKKDIDSRFEDESIIQDIQANEWEFHKDGTRY